MNNKTTAERLGAIAAAAMQGILSDNAGYALQIMRNECDSNCVYKKCLVNASFTLAKMLLEKIDAYTTDTANS